jgi:4-hydroxy-tetrahydrodipicolinate synthase
MSIKPEELRQRIRGLIHMPMTHFDENDQLDEVAIRKGLRHALNALKGEDAVFLITGSTAEFYAMTDEENMRVWNIVLEEVNGKFPIIAGTGRSGTRVSIEMSQKAQEAGVDGVLIVHPYYNLVTREGLYRHYKTIAENIDVGIMIYNNAVASKLWIPPDLMAKLSKIRNIVADKENTPSVTAYYWMQKMIDPNDMVITCGLGHLMFCFEAVVDCPAFVTELVNFAPDFAIGLYKAAKSKDFDKVKEYADRLSLYDRFISECAQRRGALPTVLSPASGGSEIPLYQSIIKSAMGLVGLPSGKVREPMENITAEEKEELKKALKKMGVL